MNNTICLAWIFNSEEQLIKCDFLFLMSIVFQALDF